MLTLTREPHWNPATGYFVNRAPKAIRPWLTEKGSLTQALINRCDTSFSVRLDKIAFSKAMRCEASALEISRAEVAFVRQVHLFCANKAWVFARTIIPQQTLRGELQRLTRLGTQPLGAVLFANKHIRRGEMQIANFSRKDQLFDQSLLYSQRECNTIWGRRSLFYLGDNPLLVSEMFLPDIPALR